MNVRSRGSRIFMVPRPWQVGVFVCLWWTLQDASAAQRPGALSPELAAELAEAFAPSFAFHADEEYFPSSPLFPLAMTGSTDRSGQLALLGTADSRTREYRSLDRQDKSEIATVYYRAYPGFYEGASIVVLEYWLYYVQNDYRVRGNILPCWFDGSHPNDLEHLHLLLRRVPGDEGAGPVRMADGAAFVMDAVYASAHEGNIPANRYRYPSPTGDRPRILVELGSHAMAPDIDADGRFTPGTDGDSDYKMLWGIRDRGITWFPYSESYADMRSEDEAPILVPRDAGAPSPGNRLTYQLLPLQALSEEFGRLALTQRERQDAFEKDVHWFRRTFGGDNGTSDRLLLPPEPDLDQDSIGIGDTASSERGVLVGTSLSVQAPGLLLGGRYSFLHRSRYLPDVVLEVDGILTRSDRYLVSQILLSYPIDGSTRVMGGRELVTDSITFARTQWNWMLAAEVKLGRMRVQGSFRSTGPVSGLTKEFRVSRFF